MSTPINKDQVYWIANRDRKTVELLTGFCCWEQVQAAIPWGFVMSDGHKANSFGKSQNVDKFYKGAKADGFRVLD